MSTGELGEWNDHLGYDCMTGGIRVGPVVLDGADYGQKRCQPITPDDLARLMADARLIAAAHDAIAALKAAMAFIDSNVADPDITSEMAENWARLQALDPHGVIAKAVLA